MPIDPFKEGKRKRTELLAIFETLPETTIHGVVGANGPGGGKTPPETRWSLALQLVAWRIPGSEIHQTKLPVTKLVTNTELDELQKSIQPNSVITFRAKLCEASPFGDARAQLIALLEPPEDNELNSIVSELKKPVVISDPDLGELTLNRSVDWYEGQITWMGQEIRISVSLDEDGSPDGALDTARELLTSMATWATNVNEYAVQKLLDLKNETWLDENESPLSAADFIQRMALGSITVYPGGDFEFWHDDGELFWGHSILVSGSLSEGLKDADIPG